MHVWGHMLYASCSIGQFRYQTSDINHEHYKLSDDDEEMLILVEFKAEVNLQSIKLCADNDGIEAASPPKSTTVLYFVRLKAFRRWILVLAYPSCLK